MPTDPLPLESEFVYDIDVWRKRIPLLDVYGKAHPNCSPVVPLLRENRRAQNPPPAPPRIVLPADMFVFGKGEPSRRDVTKINGLPYRPAGLPWPKSPSRYGENLTFLAQVRVAESRDVIGPAPGDMMLLFSERTFNDLVVEWYPLGLTDLVRPADVPPPDWTFFTGYGVRHRNVEFPAWPGRPDGFPRIAGGPLSLSGVPYVAWSSVDNAYPILTKQFARFGLLHKQIH